MTAEELNERLNYKAVRALLVSRCEAKPQLMRDVCAAYLEVHRNLAQYLHAAIRNPDIKAWIESGDDYRSVGFTQRFDLAEFMLNLPALWEFEFTKIVGTVNDANWCAAQYKWVHFIGVRPVHPAYPCGRMRIPIFHKANSRFRIGYEGRKALKRSLGSQFRSLVNFARKSTKKDFLSEFHMPPPDRSKQQRVEYPGGMIGYDDIAPYRSKRCVHLEAEELLKKTGYTSEEFWREVKQPGTVAPRKPQLELLLALPKEVNIYDSI